MKYHAFYFDSGDSGRQYHLERTVMDETWLYDRTWRFESSASSPYFGLVKTYRERALPGWAVLYRTDTTWASDAGGNPYVAEVLTTLDEGSANEKKSKVTQTVNAAGNVVSREVYGFGSLTTPARTFWYQYDTGSGCWHRDRVMWATQNGVQLFTASYGSSAWQDVPNMPMHDPAWGTEAQCRGNLQTVTGYVGDTRTRTFSYNIGGRVVTSNNGVLAVAVEQNEDYSAPARLTPNSNENLATSMAWTTFLGLATETGPNGATAAFSYL